jgi:chromosome segregation ATPase
MALNGVCELSSLLRVDDIEKTELIRKKNSLELAIKQQEGRVRSSSLIRVPFFIIDQFFLSLTQLIYEVEEHERLIGDANAAMERYSDVASSVEFSELQLNHVSSNASSMRIQDIESSISVFSSDHGATVAGMERLEEVAGRVEAAANEATAIREKNVDHQLACAQDHLSTLTDEYDKVSQEIMCVGQEICRDKDFVGSLDEQTADVTTQAESLHRQLTQAEEEYCISESARGEADQFVHQLRDDIRKLEFHNSAELGKQAQTIAQTQEKVHAEEQTIGNIDSEIVGLAELDTAARAGLEETARLETEISTAITQAEESLLAQRAEVSELTLSTSRVASETLSLRNLKASSSAQSFQGRAEALQEDIAGVEQNAAEMRAELSLTLGQVRVP